MSRVLSPLWRWVVADLGGSCISVLDVLASDRKITPQLNLPLEISGTVPSDNPLVNIQWTDGYPYLTEGVRQIYCFRKESDTDPYYTIRATGIVQQIDDASLSDDARSRFTAYDPWAYMFARPVLYSNLMDPSGNLVLGDLLGPDGGTYPSSMTADEIILDMIATTHLFAETGQPAAAKPCFIDYGQTSSYTGTIETCPTFSPSGYQVKQGTSLGQALQDICSTGYCDIIMEPIYDPDTRPGLLCQISIYSQGTGQTGAGDYNYQAIFAWDRPGRSLVGVDNLFDGTQRANQIQYFRGQGGPPVPVAFDPASIATYGQYVSQQFWPGQNEEDPVYGLAAAQLQYRSTYKETLTVNPAPERSPEPFVDYYLGDRVPVFASSRMRQQIAGWQRIFGIPVEIDDNSTETVRQLLVGPFGSPGATGSPGSIAGGGGHIVDDPGGGDDTGTGSTPTTVPTTEPPPTPSPGSLFLGLASNATTATAPYIATATAPVVRYEFSITDSAASMDSVFDDFYAEGIEVMPLAGFYASIPSQSAAENIANWATRFGPGGAYWSGKMDPKPIRWIEFGNETSFSYQFSDNSIPAYASRAQTYAVRFKQAALAVSAAVGSDVGVLCQMDDGGGWPWIQNLAIGVPNLNQYWAGVTIHPYGTGGPGKAQRCKDQASGVGWGTDILWNITEWGIATDNGVCLDDNYGFNRCMTYAQAASQFQASFDGYVAFYGANLTSFFWYEVFDLQPPGGSVSREAYFGIFQQDGTPKAPLLATFQSIEAGL